MLIPQKPTTTFRLRRCWPKDQGQESRKLPIAKVGIKIPPYRGIFSFMISLKLVPKASTSKTPVKVGWYWNRGVTTKLWHGQKRSYMCPTRMYKSNLFSIGSNVRCFSNTNATSAARANPYELLNLPKSASAAEIKSSYYDKVKTLHPDRAAAKSLRKDEYDRQVEQFREVVAAYDLLKNPKARAMYDRYGMGWDSGSTTASPFSPRRATAFRRPPQSQAEWEHWYMWAEVLRRAPHGRRSTWQFAGANRHTSDYFYGHPKMSKEEAERRAREAMPQNRRIFAALFAATWIFAMYQIQRVNSIGMQEVENSQKTSAQVAKNLNTARETARSLEGQIRQRALLDRVRQAKIARASNPSAALPPPVSN